MGIRRTIVRTVKPAIERVPALAIMYRSIRDHLGVWRKPRMTPMGFRLNGMKSMQQGTFEPAETALIARYLDEIDIFVDIGDNVGYYCCLALQRGRRTIAFEPIPANLHCLYQNIIANGWEHNVEVFPIALSDSIGLLKMYGGGTGASIVPGFGRIPVSYHRVVPVSTLDTILGNRLEGQTCLFLIDVEGAEHGVLKGAEAHLAMRPRPVWIVEIHVLSRVGGQGVDGPRMNPNLEPVFEMFRSHGYAGYTADDRFRPVTEDDLRQVRETNEDHLGTHNFVFCERV